MGSLEYEMNNAEIVTKVNELMHRGFEIPMDKLTPDATLFDQLGLDSLDAVDMLVHLEDKLSVKVEGDRFQGVRTLGDVYKLVGELAGREPGASRSCWRVGGDAVIIRGLLGRHFHRSGRRGFR